MTNVPLAPLRLKQGLLVLLLLPAGSPNRKQNRGVDTCASALFPHASRPEAYTLASHRQAQLHFATKGTEILEQSNKAIAATCPGHRPGLSFGDFPSNRALAKASEGGRPELHVEHAWKKRGCFGSLARAQEGQGLKIWEVDLSSLEIFQDTCWLAFRFVGGAPSLPTGSFEVEHARQKGRVGQIRLRLLSCQCCQALDHCELVPDDVALDLSRPGWAVTALPT